MLDLERSLQTLKAAACVLNLGANITERVRALRWSFFNPPQPQTRRALVSQEPCLEGDRLPRPGTRKEPRPGGPPDSSSPRTPPGCPGGEGARGGGALTLARLAACIAMAPAGERGLPPGRETPAGNGPRPLPPAARLSGGPGCYPSLHRASGAGAGRGERGRREVKGAGLRPVMKAGRERAGERRKGGPGGFLLRGGAFGAILLRRSRHGAVAAA